MPAPIECSGILKTSENRSRQNSRQAMKTETKKWPPKNRKPLGYKEKSSHRSGSFLAAGEGFEPSHTESESAVLPLHNPAKRKSYYTQIKEKVKCFL